MTCPPVSLGPGALRAKAIVNVMRTERPSIWLKRIALSLVFAASAAQVVSGQAARAVQADLATVLAPGLTVWITDVGGRETQTRIVSISGGIVTVTTGEDTRRLATTEIVRVRARHSDQVINGALIGAGAGVLSGLFLCSLTEPWENCRDDVGPMIRIGAIGAGVGIAIDALIRGRRTIYEAPSGSTRLRVAPIIDGRAGGVAASLSFD